MQQVAATAAHWHRIALVTMANGGGSKVEHADESDAGEYDKGVACLKESGPPESCAATVDPAVNGSEIGEEDSSRQFVESLKWELVI